MSAGGERHGDCCHNIFYDWCRVNGPCRIEELEREVERLWAALRPFESLAAWLDRGLLAESRTVEIVPDADRELTIRIGDFPLNAKVCSRSLGEGVERAIELWQSKYASAASED